MAERLAGEGAREDVVLALGERPRGDAFADALAAGPLAARAGRPILLTRGADLPEETAAALEALGARRVLIAGGAGAVAPAVEADLRGRGLLVERLGGSDRYATARLLAERAVREGAPTDLLYLVSGTNFPDALAAGAAASATGGLLLLSDPEDLGDSVPTCELLDARADQFVRIVLVGGPGALGLRLESQVRELMIRRRARI